MLAEKSGEGFKKKSIFRQFSPKNTIKSNTNHLTTPKHPKFTEKNQSNQIK